jgi:hypothetical protein
MDFWVGGLVGFPGPETASSLSATSRQGSASRLVSQDLVLFRVGILCHNFSAHRRFPARLNCLAYHERAQMPLRSPTSTLTLPLTMVAL